MRKQFHGDTTITTRQANSSPTRRVPNHGPSFKQTSKGQRKITIYLMLYNDLQYDRGIQEGDA
jgi:hypothetical protein